MRAELCRQAYLFTQLAHLMPAELSRLPNTLPCSADEICSGTGIGKATAPSSLPARQLAVRTSGA